MSNDEVIEIYALNGEEVNKVWEELGEEATLREAVEEWVRRQLGKAIE